MQNVVIVIHLMVVLALVGVVLLQRSEGGGLGIGGGSGFMSARSTANALTRATAILAAAFFCTSIALTLIARYGDKATDVLDRVPAAQTQQGEGGVLNQLGGKDIPAPEPAAPAAETPTAPAAPAGDAPAAATPAAPAAESPAAPAPAAPAADPAAPAVTLPATPEAPASVTEPAPTPAVPNN
jgi:preprotein translocase subunit SecG